MGGPFGKRGIAFARR